MSCYKQPLNLETFSKLCNLKSTHRQKKIKAKDHPLTTNNPETSVQETTPVPLLKKIYTLKSENATNKLQFSKNN